MNKSGWICARCNASFSPFMMECNYCNKEKKEYAQRNTTEEIFKPQCIHEWDTSFVLTSNPPKYRCKKCGQYSEGIINPESILSVGL